MNTTILIVGVTILIVICLFALFTLKKKKELYFNSTKKDLLPYSLIQKFRIYTSMKIDNNSIKNKKIKQAVETLSKNLKILHSSYKQLNKYLKNTKITDSDYYSKVENALKITKINLPIPTRNEKLLSKPYKNNLLIDILNELNKTSNPDVKESYLNSKRNFTKKCTGKLDGIKWGNFCGPSGKWAEVKDNVPCDETDSCCKKHDEAYSKCTGWCKNNSEFTGAGGCAWDECIVAADLLACICWIAADVEGASEATFNAGTIAVFCFPLRYILAIVVLGIKWIIKFLLSIGGWIVGFLIDIFTRFADTFKYIFKTVYDGVRKVSRKEIIADLEDIIDTLINDVFTTDNPEYVPEVDNQTVYVPDVDNQPVSHSQCNSFTQQICYQDTLINKCWRCSELGCQWVEIERNRNPGICCRVECINGVAQNICGSDFPESRSIGNQPITQNPIAGYDCSNNIPVRREPTPNQGNNSNSGSYCDSHDCSNYPCDSGYRSACSNGELRPEGCFCDRN